VIALIAATGKDLCFAGKPAECPGVKNASAIAYERGAVGVGRLRKCASRERVARLIKHGNSRRKGEKRVMLGHVGRLVCHSPPSRFSGRSLRVYCFERIGAAAVF